MTLFDPKTMQELGTDSNNRTVIIGTLYCDTIADLPAPNDFTGFALSMGFRAVVINDNSVHRLNSVGQWVQIVSGNSTYTRAEIDNIVNGINADLLSQQTQIDYLVNTGAKNYLILNQTSGTASGVDWAIDPQTGFVTATRASGTTDSTKKIAEYTQTAGTYIFTSHPNASFTTADSFITSGGTTLARDIDGYQTFTLAQDAIINVYCRIRGNAASADYRPMIRPSFVTDSTFTPYAPTNRELYNLIRGYHP